MLALQDIGDYSLFYVILTACHHSHPHTVATHGKHRVALTDKDGLATIVGQERVLAVCLANERAFLHLSLQVQTVVAPLRLTEIVVPCHLLKHIDSQHFCRMRVES